MNRKAKYGVERSDSIEQVLEAVLNEVIPQGHLAATWKYDFQVEIPGTEIIVSSGTVYGFGFSPESFKEVFLRFLARIERRDSNLLHGCNELLANLLHGCNKLTEF